MASSAGASQPPDGELIRERRRRQTLFGISMGTLLVVVDVTAFNVALPTLQRDFDTSIAGLQWVVSSYIAAFCGFLLSAGRLSDRIGAKKAFLLGVGLFTGASLACCLAWSVASLVTMRFVQGIGAAVIAASSTALLGSEYPDAKARTKALTVFSTVPTFGLFGGPVAGGLLVDRFGWESVFAINVVLGPIVVLAVLGAIATPGQPAVKEDVLGQVIGVFAIVGLAIAVIEGGVRGFTDPWVLAGLVIGVGAIVAFVRVERSRDDALLPRQLFASSPYVRCVVAGGLWVFSAYGISFVLTTYMQQEMGYSPAQTGLAFLPQSVAPLVTNLMIGRLVGRYGGREVARAALAVASLGMSLLLFVNASGPYWVIAVSMIITGFGAGLINIALAHEVLTVAPSNRHGIASGVYNCMRQVGNLAGAVVLGLFLQTWSTSLTFGFHVAVVAVTVSVGCASVFVLRRAVPAPDGHRIVSPG